MIYSPNSNSFILFPNFTIKVILSYVMSIHRIALRGPGIGSSSAVFTVKYLVWMFYMSIALILFPAVPLAL